MGAAPRQPMTHPDPIVSREIPLIAKIVRDETWLEGERRGCHVSPGDPVVQEHVCQIILRIGHELRRSLAEQVAGACAQQDDLARHREAA